MQLCEKINDKLIFFEDLNEEEKHQIQVHLDDCKNCREKLRDFQSIMSAIKTNQEHPIEDELLTRYSIYLAAPGEVDYDGAPRLDESESTCLNVRSVRRRSNNSPENTGK